MQAKVREMRTEMKKLETCIILATTNLVLLGLAFLARVMHVGCCSLGSPANIVAMVVVPILLILTVVLAIRDLVRSTARLQGVIALLLSVPSAILVFSTRF